MTDNEKNDGFIDLFFVCSFSKTGKLCESAHVSALGSPEKGKYITAGIRHACPSRIPKLCLRKKMRFQTRSHATVLLSATAGAEAAATAAAAAAAAAAACCCCCDCGCDCEGALDPACIFSL